MIKRQGFLDVPNFVSFFNYCDYKWTSLWDEFVKGYKYYASTMIVRTSKSIFPDEIKEK